MSDRRVEPTARQQREAWQRGDAPMSRLLVAAGGFVAALVALEWSAGRGWSALADLARHAWAGQGDAEALVAQARQMGLVIVAPVAAAAVGGALLVGLAQTRGLLLPGARSDGEVSGSRSERLAGAWRYALISSAVVLLATGLERASLGRAVAAHGRQSLLLVTASLFHVCLRVGSWMIVVGLADYLLRRARWLEAHRLTRAEAESARREDEGDPRLALERRRRFSTAGTRPAVPLDGAELILTADSIAVGLREADARAAVTVVATDAAARALVDAARAARVPVRHDPALVAALSSAGPIPPDALTRALALVTTARAL